MSIDNYYVITKENIENYLNELGKLISKKKPKGFHAEIIIVGGASVLLNYGFRFNSEDIDCSDRQGVLMNDVINTVACKFNLPNNWINTDFIRTKSYSNKLDQYSKFYKTYGYGVLDVRTIKDEYLVAMKLVSARKYKNDYSDIYGIINECRNNDYNISFETVVNAVIDLYGSIDVADREALEFVKKVIEQPELIDFKTIKMREKEFAVNVKQLNKKGDSNTEDIEYLLKKLEFLD